MLFLGRFVFCSVAATSLQKIIQTTQLVDFSHLLTPVLFPYSQVSMRAVCPPVVTMNHCTAQKKIKISVCSRRTQTCQDKDSR